MSDALYPVFDASGKYLYFTASTDMGLTAGLARHDEHRPPGHAQRLRGGARQGPAVADRAGERRGEGEGRRQGEEGRCRPCRREEGGRQGQGRQDEAAAKVEIDFDGLDQRIVALPIPAKNYRGLWAGKEGTLFLVAGPLVDVEAGPPPLSVSRFDLKSRKTEPLLEGVSAFALSANGEKVLYRSGPAWFIVSSDKAPKAGDGALAMKGLKVYVDPKAEWAQMYREVWRIERDFFYDPHFHGLDLAAAEKAYAPYLAGIASRDDLTSAVRGDDRQPHRRPHVRPRRRRAEERQGERRAAGRGLHDRRRAATGSPAFTTVRTGTPSCRRR